MKVLWITHTLMPEATELLTGSKNVDSSSGWLVGASKALLNSGKVQLFVASVTKLVSNLKVIKGNVITYYFLPYGKGNKKINTEYDRYWVKINQDIVPDVVHIHGSEYSHGYSFMNACGSKNVVLSIQGMPSKYYYYYYGMTFWDLAKNLTIYDIRHHCSIISGYYDFKRRGFFEKEMIRMVPNIIGRTSWDRANTWAINPDAHYFFCNETLRDVFYDGARWEYKNCHHHSIFISQAGYPLKGLHMVLRALPYVLREFPDASVRVAGVDITQSRWKKFPILLPGYPKYILSLINKFNLQKKVSFTGYLNAQGMKEEFLRANLFVSPSSIENSPNSLGEAQILGVPCISSYVGGSMDMMLGNEQNLYRFEEVEMLAYKICKVFRNKECHINMRSIALERHDQFVNANTLLKIYNSIVNI